MALRVFLLAASIVMAVAWMSGGLADRAMADSLPRDLLSALDPDLQQLPVAARGRLTALESAGPADQGISRPSAVAVRSVRVDLQSLQALVNDAAVAVAGNRLATRPSRFQMALDDDLNVDLVKTDAVRSTLGLTVVRAHLLKPSEGDATLVVGAAGVTGYVLADHRQFRITPMAGDRHLLTEFREPLVSEPDRRAPRSAQHALGRSEPPTQESPSVDTVTAAASAAVTINMLVGYTDEAKRDLGDIESTITLAVDYMNQALSNSHINAHVTLVQSVPVNYIENGGSSDQILDDLTYGTGDFSRLQTLRATTNADIVSVIASFTDACGVGWINDDITSTTVGGASAYAYNIVSSAFGGDCLPITLAHESGHNMGSQHDRYVIANATPGPTAYNYGYVDTLYQFRDIMSYANHCTDLKEYCPVVPYYSNPNVYYGIHPVGVPDYLSNAADNSRKMTNQLAYITQFHDYLAAPLVASILPGDRSVQTGTTATVFATMINSGSSPLSGCTVDGPAALPSGGTFSFQQTNPSTNQTVGTVNTPVDLAAGGVLTLVLGIESPTAVTLQRSPLYFGCKASDGSNLYYYANPVGDLNTLDFSASATPVPDIIALAATPTDDGALRLTNGGQGAFAVATDNLGTTATITVTVGTGTASLPLTLSICQTYPSNGACVSSPASQTTATISAAATPTFSIFAQANGTIPFDPGVSRIFVRFFDGSGAERGSTSVAVAAQ